jgi:hypothetical protein
MVALDIQHFSEGRTKARAYFCYLFYKNIPNKLPGISLDMVMSRLLKIKAELETCEGVYILDHRGVQVSPTFTLHGTLDDDAGKIRADRAYYYRAVKEKRCTITDPYPSLIGDDLTITASQPIYDDKGELLYIVCLDMPLADVLKISHLTKLDTFFGRFFKYSYALFSIALVGIAMMLFLKGIENFLINGMMPSKFAIKDMFNSTILLTLSLAIFDLSKTLIEEEIMGRLKERNVSGPHKTMVRFLGSIIIALSIEALMLVFKFALTDPDQLLYAMYIIAGVSMLVISLAIYIKFTKLRIED